VARSIFLHYQRCTRIGWQKLLKNYKIKSKLHSARSHLCIGKKVEMILHL
jgi:hypothetical protein